MVFGVSMVSFTIYGTIALIFVIMQHSNIRLLNFIERYACYIFFLTWDGIKIHHSNEQKYTDSHMAMFYFLGPASLAPGIGSLMRLNMEKNLMSPKQTAGYLLKSPYSETK